MTVLDATQDAFGRALLDHHEGRPGPRLMLEADDGSLRPADLQPKEFFQPHDAWPWWEQRAIGQAQGAVLDLWIDPRGITVRGTLRTRRLAWAISHRSTWRHPLALAESASAILLRNGEAIKVDAIQQPRFGPDFTTSIVQELNDALASATMPARPDAP